MSADSGLATFRDANGLWEGYKIDDVASVDGWKRNPENVLHFYNSRRKQALEATPNAGHKAIARLEEKYDVAVITQNVDDLHERGGSTNVLHLHGELRKARSEIDSNLVYDIGNKPILYGDLADDGAQLRPDIVWFGENVTMMERAVHAVKKTDILIVIGTSLVVYPAAGLVDVASAGTSKYMIDPSIPELHISDDWHFIKSRAAVGTSLLVDDLISDGM